jgi:hypothetical protein
VQIKVLGKDHNCTTTKLVEGKMASQSWVADRLTDWLKKNPNKGPKATKEKRGRLWNKGQVQQGIFRHAAGTAADSW